jgi:hypothetical protein
VWKDHPSYSTAKASLKKAMATSTESEAVYGTNVGHTGGEVLDGWSAIAENREVSTAASHFAPTTFIGTESVVLAVMWQVLI